MGKTMLALTTQLHSASHCARGYICREGLHLTSLGMSPYTGSAYHGAPLLLPLLQSAALSPSPLMLALPHVAADIWGALALRRIAGALHLASAWYHRPRDITWYSLRVLGPVKKMTHC